jgi:threonine/homoserine/homoserine lactone efflux protein
MHLLLEGTLWGIALSILVGPIFFAVIQAGIERGFRAAIILSTGVWLSDFLYIIAAYTGVSYLTVWINDPHFKELFGIIGGGILILSGLITLLSKAPQTDQSNIYEELKNKDEKDKFPYFSLWLKGFLVNSFNPFTVFFWIGLNTNMATRPSFNKTEALIFFGSIWGTIVLIDLAKSYLAKVLKRVMKPHYILRLRQGCAIAMIIFGIILLIRIFVLKE